MGLLTQLADDDSEKISGLRSNGIGAKEEVFDVSFSMANQTLNFWSSPTCSQATVCVFMCVCKCCGWHWKIVAQGFAQGVLHTKCFKAR